jgi:two-component system, chemotaxis family, protein-glutamate methylesterase/glutaminase
MSTHRRIVVIGASAGGIDALRSLLSELPPDFPVPIGIVIHTAAESPGVLAQIFQRWTRLHVTLAFDTCPLQPGHVYVAPPDRHLLVEPGRVRTTKGPREHGFRPAVDPLFRSAAQVYGPGAIGVILSGNLDDGSAGLWTIKKLGGIAVVQDPADALFPSMPFHALEAVDADHVARLSEIPSILAELATGMPLEAASASMPEHINVEVNIAKEQNPRDAGLERIGKPSPYACPDCHGVLLELEEGNRFRFRCHIGHAYSVDSLLAAMNEAIEHAMSTAVRSLEEARLLMDRMALLLDRRNDRETAARLRESSLRAKRKAEVMNDLMRESDATVPTLDQ